MIHKVLVKPNSSKVLVEKIDYNGEKLLRIKVKSAPQDGEANKELVKVLAEYFQVSIGSIILKSGARSKFKYIEII